MVAVLAHAHADDIVTAHLPLIRTIARRLSKRLPPSVEVEELVNIGVLGLMDAHDRFDATKGVPFKSYAEMRIKGQMIDALRADDIVPRSVRRKHNRLEQERAQLTHRLGRAPNHEEVREQLDLNEAAYTRYVNDATVARVVSLDAPVGEEGDAALVDCLARPEGTAEDDLGTRQLRKSVAVAVAHLPEKERAAVTLYYLQRMTLKEIGEHLGVTESRACQLRGQGVKRLQYRLRNLMA